MAEKILHHCRLCEEALGTVGQMLQTALEEHRQRQLMGVAGDVRMLRVAEGTGRIVHRADDVAGEGQGGIVCSRLLGEVRHIVVPLSAIDALRRHKVRPCALPSARDRGAVEVDQQVVTGSTLEEVDAVVHVLLCVAAEEVDLHAGYAYLLAPGEFLLTILGLVQTELRARGAVDPAY